MIEPFVQLLGKTKIGTECRIRSYSVIENCTLGNDVLIRQSMRAGRECSRGSGARIGPFAHLRPGSEIGQEAHVGNFVETKKAKLGKGAKANHLTYLGDAEVGAGSNIGAGVITCNYDGVTQTPDPHWPRSVCGQRFNPGCAGVRSGMEPTSAPVRASRRMFLQGRWRWDVRGRSSKKDGQRPEEPAEKRRRSRAGGIGVGHADHADGGSNGMY